MIINIYDKNTLEIIGRPVISSLEDFEKNPTLFFPDFNKENHIFSEIEYQNPVLEKGKLRESTKEELYKSKKYTFPDPLIVLFGKPHFLVVKFCNLIQIFCFFLYSSSMRWPSASIFCACGTVFTDSE